MTARALIPVKEVSGRVHPLVYANKAVPLPENYRIPANRPAIRLHELDLYVTMRCNLTCEFCNVRAGEYDHRDLPLERIRSLIDEAADLGLRECHLLGGEPLLRRDLDDIVAHAVSRGLHTRVITNGILLDDRRLDRLLAAGLHEVMLSVDGMADNHNRLRQSGESGWDVTIAAAQRCIDRGVRTRVSMVAYADNYDDTIPLLRCVEAMGGDIFSVFLGSPLGRGNTMHDRVITPRRWRELQDEVTRVAATMRPDLQVVMEQGFAWSDGPAADRSQLKGRGTGCNTLLDDFDYLIARSDGNLYQCVFFMTEGRPIGNIAEQPLLETLHHALDLAEYRPFTVANDRCSSCFHSDECGTGCRGYAYLYEDDWLKTDPRCSKTDPADTVDPPHFPLCPIMKLNVRSGLLGGSTEQALERSVVS